MFLSIITSPGCLRCCNNTALLLSHLSMRRSQHRLRRRRRRSAIDTLNRRSTAAATQLSATASPPPAPVAPASAPTSTFASPPSTSAVHVVVLVAGTMQQLRQAFEQVGIGAELSRLRGRVAAQFAATGEECRESGCCRCYPKDPWIF